MKVDITNISPENFMVHQHYVGEHEVFLVQPIHIGATWTNDTLHFRSVVVDKVGDIVSASFKKFFNCDEKPDLTPAPKSLDGASLMEKLDGSTLIFSRYKGHTVVRTRGTVDARKQENGQEIDFLLEKYSKFKEILESVETTNISYIFEWLSPLNRIVLNYGDEADMALVGVIFHKDYSMVTQNGLDVLAAQMHLRRPQTFKYDSVADMKAAIEALRDQEGLCVYYNDDQNIRKVKSAHYLFLHRAKSEVSSIEKVLDLYINEFIANGAYMPYVDFMAFLEKTFDFEIASMARGHVSRICDAMKEVRLILTALINCATECKALSRKDAAVKIIQAYGSTGRSPIVFKQLDGKPLMADDYKKLLYQCLKD